MITCSISSWSLHEHRLADMLSERPEGRFPVDVLRFHEVEPA
ncbi:MAG: hypothetical protein AB7K71_18865 [Polyangiaceae bacterium]